MMVVGLVFEQTQTSHYGTETHAQRESSADTRQTKHNQSGVQHPEVEDRVGVLFTAAILSVMLRVGVRLKTRKPLHVDDYMVLFAAAGLCAITALLFRQLPNACLSEALNQHLVAPTPQELESGIGLMMWLHIFMPLMWLVVYTIKFAILYFFQGLIRSVSRRLTRYFWVVVVLVTIFWIFSSFMVAIVCPGTGKKCLWQSRPDKMKHRQRQEIVNGIIGAMDVISDLLIITIPPLVLHKSLMRTRQKISIGMILCLSSFMIMMALIRVVGPIFDKKKITSESGNVAVTWLLYWSEIEACTAVIMSSAIVIRSIFIKSPAAGGSGVSARPRVLPSWWRSGTSKGQHERLEGKESDETERLHLKELASPVRVRQVELSTNSKCSFDEAELNYHHIRRLEMANAGK